MQHFAIHPKQLSKQCHPTHLILESGVVADVAQDVVVVEEDKRAEDLYRRLVQHSRKDHVCHNREENKERRW